MEDPNPEVNGQGHARLRDAGIVVEVGEGASEAAEINAGFLLRVRAGRPLFHLKLASSLDGRIATASGESKWITGDGARADGHRLRASHDAILVGAGTVAADDPDLTCRLPGAQNRSPIRVVLDTRLETDPAARLVRGAGAVETLFVCGEDAPRERQRVLEDAGAAVIRVAVRDEMIDIAAALSVAPDCAR